MPSLAEYEAWKARNQQANVGKANVVLSQPFPTMPDEYAADLNLAKEASAVIGNPIPPMMMSDPTSKSVFQKIVEEKKRSTILSSSPRLTDWLRTPGNAELARDDLEGLSVLEGLGNSVQRGLMRPNQMYNQWMAEGAAQRAGDQTRSFGDIYGEERANVGPIGNVLDNAVGPITDLWNASSRVLQSQLSEAFGGDQEQAAAYYQQQVGLIGNQIAAIPVSSVAAASRDRIMGSESTGSAEGDAAQFFAAVGEDPAGFATWMAEVVGENIPALATATAAGILTRNPSVSAAMLGTLSGTQERFLSPPELMAERGIDISTPEGALAAITDPDLMRDAAERGEIRGVIIGALDTISGGVAGEVLAKNPLANLAIQSVVGSMLGGGGEALGQIASGQKLNIGDVLIEALAEFVTAPIEVGGMAASRLAEGRAKATGTDTHVETMTEMSAAAANSALRNRSPDTFRDYAATALAGPSENLYVPADKFTEYFQSNDIDPFAIADQLTGMSRADVQTAIDTGGSVKIPTATWATDMAGGPHDQFIIENSAFSPDDMTAFEAAEFEADKTQLMNEAWEEAEAIRQDAEHTRAVYEIEREELIGHLRAAGRATDVATAEALPMVEFRRVIAERSGLTPEEFASRYPLPRVEGERPEGLDPKNVDALTRTLAEARARRAVGLEKRGPTLLEFISERGGIVDPGGELNARDAAVVKRGRKNLRLERGGLRAAGDLFGLTGTANGMDDVARAAIEAGYMASDPEVLAYLEAQRSGAEVPDITRPLLAAIDRELAGQSEFADGIQALDEGDGLDSVEEYLASLGLSLDDDDAAIRAALDQDGREYGQADAGFQGGGARGAIRFPSAGISNGETLVSLFQRADLSTFLHESGHYFLTVTQDMASLDPSGPVAGDYQAVKDWWHQNAADVAADAGNGVAADDVRTALDAGTTGDAVKDAAIDTGMQEQFARAVEQYFLEGKAPSPTLRAAFEKFRAWLVSIYKTMRGLNVNVTDELRGVFDRMLATDTEIDAARQDIGADVNLTAADLGMTDEQFAGFLKLRDQAKADASARALEHAMQPIRRAATKAYQEERSRVHADIVRNLKLQPVYRAIQELRFGKDFEGGEVTPLKLNRAMIEKDYWAGYVPHLPGATKDGGGHKNAVFSTEGGVHPDIAAGAYGFPSGGAMLDALANAHPLDDVANAETEKAMRERHNDPLLDGSIEKIAMDATHNDRQGQVLAAQLEAFNAVAGTDRGLTHKAAREIARRTLKGMKVKDATRQDRFLTAERKAAAEVARLSATVTRTGMWMERARRRVETQARGAVRDADGAATLSLPVEAANQNTERFNESAAALVEAKRRQLLNHMIYSEARKVSVETDMVLARVGALNKSDARLSKVRDMNYVKGARAVAAKFGMARPDRAFDFTAWVEQLRFDDPITASAIVDAIATYAEEAQHFKELTVSEFGAVKDAIDSLLELGKSTRSIEVDGRRIERQEAIDAMIHMAEPRAKKRAGLDRAPTKREKNFISALTTGAALVRTEAWARDMDDGTAGVFTRYIVKPVMDALGVYRADRAERLSELLAIVEPRRGDLFGKTVNAPEIGYTFESKGALIHALLHTGNESNKRKLLLGRGWSKGMIGQQQAISPSGKPRVDRQGQPIMDKGTLDTSRWDAMVERLIADGTITADDKVMIEQIWGLMDKIKRPAQSAHRQIYGHYFREVEATPFTNLLGTWRGGYVPAIIDQYASIDAGKQDAAAALDSQMDASMFPSTGSGFTKGRVEYNQPLALNLTMLPSHMDKVLRFTHLEPTIRQTSSLLSDRGLRGVVSGVNRDAIDAILTPWLVRTARQAVETPSTDASGREAGKVWRAIRKRVGLHMMAINIVNAAQQVTGIPSAAVLVKVKHLKAATVRFAKDAGAMRTEAMEASDMMRDRMDNSARVTAQEIDKIIVAPTIQSEVDQFVNQHGYILQQGTQNVVDVIVWHGAYDQAIRQGMADADAVFEADSVVRRTQGSFNPEDVSRFETGTALQRMFTMFTSYFNTQLNLVGGEALTTIRTMGWAGKGRLFHLYFFGVMIPAVVAEATSQAARGELGDDDDDGLVDDMLDLFIGSQVKFVTGAIPFLGPLTMAALNKFNDQPWDDQLSVSPAIYIGERVMGAPANIWGAAADDKSPSRAVADGLTALGLIIGVPTGQLAKSAGYLVGVGEDKSKPKNVGDVLRGVMSGRDGTE